MYSRSKRNIPCFDYNLLNTVGFENKNMSSSEEDRTQSESGLDVASGRLPDTSKGQNDDDNELSQLRDAVAKKEAEKKKLIEAEKKRLREQLDKSTQEVKVLKAKKQKKGTRKADLSINTLRSDKKLKSKVAFQLHKLALKDDGSDSEYDTACTDSFIDLSFSLLVAGELEIIADCKSSERRGTTALLKKIAYYNTTYSIEGLKKFYSACLRQVEKGEKPWSDDFSNLEQPILSKNLLPVETPFKKKFTSTTKASA